MTKAPESKIKLWEILLCLPILGATIGFIVQRRDFFYQAERDFFSDDNLILYGVILGLTALPALSLLAKTRTRLGRYLRIGTCLVGILLIGAFLVARHPKARYQAFRSDCIGMQAGFTAHDTPRKELVEELVDPEIGPLIAQDLPLLKHLVLVNGSQFLKHPRSARVALANLKAQGLSVEDVRKGPEGQTFLEVALIGEGETDPWLGIEWVDSSKTTPVEELNFSAGLFTKQEAQQVVDEALSKLPETSQDTFEHLLATMMKFSGLLTRTQGDEILAAWAENLGERAEILEPGADLRQELIRLLGDTSQLKVHFDLEIVEYFVPEDVDKKNLDVTFKRSVLGLVRACGVTVEETSADQADLVIAATLKDTKLYEYEQNIYELRSSYVPNSQARRIGRSSLRVGSTQTKAVVVGTQTAIRRGPGFTLEFRYQGKIYDTEMALLYWYQWVVVNDKEPDYSKLNNDGTWGRLWPFGVNEDLLRPHCPR